MSNPAPSPDVVTLSFSGALTVATAEDHRRQLVAALERAQTVRLDLAAVDAVDVFGLQLLHAAQRSARSRGKRLELAPLPAGFAAACARAAIDPAAVGAARGSFPP